MTAPVIEVTVVASDHPIWKGQASFVSIPAYEGSMGILPNHEPVLTLIKEGIVSVVTNDEERREFNVSSGFIAFENNRLTVTVESGVDMQGH